MSRRRRSIDSSLELLLDTICNTFGGVLFMAILLAMLVKSAAHDTRANTDSSRSNVNALKLQTALIDANTERDALLLAVEQQKTSQSRLVPPQAQSSTKNLLASSIQRESLLKRLEEARLELSKSRAIQQAVEKDLLTLDQTLKVLEADVQERQMTLEKEIRSRTQVTPIPRLHRSSKREIGLILRFHRIYSWQRYSPTGVAIGLNDTDLVVVKETALDIQVLPKPYAGMPVNSATVSNDFGKLLAPFDPRSEHITVIVSTDSFDECVLIKQSLVARGFEYRLMPTKNGERVYDRGGQGQVQ
jgi:hypothetical protein